MSEMYGNSQAEENLQRIMTCRQIVKEIVDFGVTQEQIVMIIQGLAYELENHDHMVEVVGLTKALLESMKPTMLVEKA